MINIDQVIKDLDNGALVSRATVVAMAQELKASHDLLTKYCVADLIQGGEVATLQERIAELHRWYEAAQP